jgi:predicted DNA-binding antitoxin AbrB/MazE fold protein
MSIKVAYRDGVFEPLEKVERAEPGAIYTVLSDAELREFFETLGWLKAAETSFDFWDNAADAVYDRLSTRRDRGVARQMLSVNSG